jgi:hypothetical protein
MKVFLKITNLADVIRSCRFVFTMKRSEDIAR